MDPKDWVAIYAAVVSSTVAAFQIRQWLSAGPRLVVTITPEAEIIGAGQDIQESDL